MLNRFLEVSTTPILFKNFIVGQKSAITSMDAELVLFILLTEGGFSLGFQMSLPTIPVVRELR